MTFIYSPRDKCHAKLDRNYCVASVSMGGRMIGFHQCLRDNRKGKLRPDEDGNLWCKQHHPDTVQEKREKRDEEFNEKRRFKQAKFQREDACAKFCAGVSTEYLERNKLGKLLAQIHSTSVGRHRDRSQVCRICFNQAPKDKTLVHAKDCILNLYKGGVG